MDKTMDWFKLIKDTYFLKDKAGEEIYGKKLLEFLEKKEPVFTLGTDEEKWDKLFNMIDEWSMSYLADVKFFKLDGIEGWFLNITYASFRYSNEINMDISEYLYVISLICWRNVEHFGGRDKNCFMKRAWETDFYYFFHYEENFSCQSLSKADFFMELHDRYMRSYKGFNDFLEVHPEKKTKLEREYLYSKYHEYINQLDNAIGQNDTIMRINGFGNCSEPYWYVIIGDNLIYLINIEDFA